MRSPLLLPRPHRPTRLPDRLPECLPDGLPVPPPARLPDRRLHRCRGRPPGGRLGRRPGRCLRGPVSSRVRGRLASVLALPLAVTVAVAVAGAAPQAVAGAAPPAVAGVPGGDAPVGGTVNGPGSRATDAGEPLEPAAPKSASAEGRSWPLAGRPAVARGWEPPTGPYAPGHRGVDLAADPGDAVLAAADGTVAYAGRVAGRGVLVIEVAGVGEPPTRTTYEPVTATVAVGDQVAAGDPVGVLEAGPSHCAGSCLHWGLRRGDVYLDPLSLLTPDLLHRPPSRLLPLTGAPAEADGRTF